MLLQVDCIPCIMTMTIKSLRKLNLSEPAIKRLYNDILTIRGLRGNDWSQTSPDIIEIIMNKVYQTLGDTDPFRDVKIALNQRVQDMLPYYKKLIQNSSDPVYTAAKLAILGNSIDLMMPGGTAALEEYIREMLKMELVYRDYHDFRKRLSKTKNVLYFTDNCGEIVLDKLFIQVLQQHYNLDFTIVTRYYPTLNDATLREARDIGMEDVGAITDSGIDGPLPGTRLSRSAPKIQKLMKTSDLIIAKGGGNFDSLEEDLKTLKTNITFMLLAKCHPVKSYFKTRLHQPIIANFHWLVSIFVFFLQISFEFTQDGLFF